MGSSEVYIIQNTCRASQSYANFLGSMVHINTNRYISTFSVSFLENRTKKRQSVLTQTYLPPSRRKPSACNTCNIQIFTVHVLSLFKIPAKRSLLEHPIIFKKSISRQLHNYQKIQNKINFPLQFTVLILSSSTSQKLLYMALKKKHSDF